MHPQQGGQVDFLGTLIPQTATTKRACFFVRNGVKEKMVYYSIVSSDAGRNLAGVLRQLSTTGTTSKTWNNSTSAWESSVSSTDRKIDAVEEVDGRYRFSVSVSLGTYTGDVNFEILDEDQSDLPIGNETVYAVAGAVGQSTASPTAVAKHRTWFVGAGESDRSPNVVTLADGAQVTLAFDFTAALNPDSRVSSVSSVTGTNSLTTSSLAPSGDGRQAHFDVSSLTAGTRYEVTCTVGTSDGQTMTGRGVLKCET